MHSSEMVIERALSVVAAGKALRERNLARRAEVQRRVESVANQPLYLLSKGGGQQLSLNLDS